MKMKYNDDEYYKYTLHYNMLGNAMKEECFIGKDSFWPYGEVKIGQKTRGEFGFMEIVKVYDEPHVKYGKFIAKSITYVEMDADLKR